MSLTFNANNGITWPLDGTVGVRTINEDEGIFTIPTDLVIDQRVNSDGGVLVNSRRSPRRVSLTFFLEVASDAADGELLQLWASFFSALASGGELVYNGPNGERTLRDIVLEGPDRSMTGRDIQFRDEDAYQVSLLALDPWWYGTVQAVAVTPLTAATAWDAAISWDAVLPWDGGSTATVIVEGDAPASPQFLAFFDVVDLVVSNGVMGWSMARAVGAVEIITVDSRAGSRGPKVGTDLIGGFPLRPTDWTLLTEDSRLFDLPVGTSSIIYNATSSGGSGGFNIYWEPRWLTP